jgi:brefeldin A-inhibited guanine nucleotide-exchange protein 3
LNSFDLNFIFSRQYLCPTLIHLLGSPVSEVGAKTKNQGAYPEDGGRGGRGVGSPLKSKPLQSVARIIYNISKELIRLVGPMGTMRPVLESLFHRIILYPPPQQRAEALKAINDVSSPHFPVKSIANCICIYPIIFIFRRFLPVQVTWSI